MTQRAFEERIDEWVLGLASEAEAQALEALCERDAEVAARVERVRARFAALDETAEPLAIPADFWDRIEASLEGAPEEVTESAPLEPAPTASAEVIELAPLRRAATRWRAVALSGVAAALLMVAVLGATLMTPTQPAVVAVLLDAQGQPVAVIDGRKDNTTLVTLLGAANVPGGQVMQVWTKPRDDGPPVSLGLLDPGTSRTLSGENLPPPHPDQLYEITFEPSGGSPTNLPTGPIYGKGFAKSPVY